MQPHELSRGARRLLARLEWYQRRHRHGTVFPFQKTLAGGLGVCDRTVRSYLKELKDAGLVCVQQGGDGHSATYHLSSTPASGLPSGLLPGCFRAESQIQIWEQPKNLPLADENFRAEALQSKSNCSLDNDQSRSTVVRYREPTPALIENTSQEQAQTEAIVKAVLACGFELTPSKLAELQRKCRHYKVPGFRVVAAINRAYKLVAGTSNEPRSLSWFTAVVENELAEERRGATPRASPRVDLGILDSCGGDEDSRLIPDKRSEMGLMRVSNAISPALRGLVGLSA